MHCQVLDISFLLVDVVARGILKSHAPYAAAHDARNTTMTQYSNSMAQTHDLVLVTAVYTNAMVDGIEPLRMHAFAKLA